MLMTRRDSQPALSIRIDAGKCVQGARRCVCARGTSVRVCVELLAAIESVEAASDVCAPASGVILSTNDALIETFPRH